MKTRALLAVLLAACLLPCSALAKKGRGKTTDGATLFSENCAGCHGNGGRGDGPNSARLQPAPPDLTKSRASEDVIAGVVRDGKGSCPKWRASLSEEEIAAIAKWTHSLQR